MSAVVLVAYPAAGLQGRSRGWPRTLPPSRSGEKIAKVMLTASAARLRWNSCLAIRA